MHVDLDHFKQINDTMGHAAGDYVLQNVAEILRNETRDNDFIARIGGDEFVIILRAVPNPKIAAKLAARIIESASRPILFEGDYCAFGVSIGIEYVTKDNKFIEDPSKILQNADIALYRAKELGRGQYAFYEAEMSEKLRERKSLSDDIILGLPRGEFVPYYQPQIDATTGHLKGVEALARWNHPGRGVIPPGVFLPVAERLGLVPVIDRKILVQAISDLKRWDAEGLYVPRVSVNLSAHQLKSPDLVSFLRDIHVPRGRLVFEVLESVFADAVDGGLRHALDELRNLGIEIEVDDFGTGHASLVGLLALAPTRLKIARELIDPMPSCDRHVEIVSSIVAIAKSLNIGVTAEGIETAEHHRLAKSLGCSALQGFLFAKPMPAHELAAAAQSAGAAGADRPQPPAKVGEA